MQKTLLALLFAVVPFSVFAQDGPAANREITAQPGQELRDLEAIRYTRLLIMHNMDVATAKTDTIAVPIDGVIEEIIYSMLQGADQYFQVSASKHAENSATTSSIAVTDLNTPVRFGQSSVVRVNTRSRVIKGDSIAISVDGAAATGTMIVWIRIAH